MQDERSPDAVQGPVGQPIPQSTPVIETLPSTPIAPSSPPPPPSPVVQGHVHQPRAWKRWALIILIPLALMLLVGSIVALVVRSGRTPPSQVGDFGVVKLPLGNLKDSSIGLNLASSLKVNGQLQVSNSLILTPSPQPGAPVSGQIYFDQDTERLYYYNGQQFVNIAAVGDVAGAAGAGSVTNITNVASAGVAAVQLQSTSPGVQQTGSFNVSGTGKVGALSTTVIKSDGQTLYVNPLEDTVQFDQQNGTAATAGLTTIGSFNTGTGIQNNFIATKVTLGPTNGTANSISVYTAAGNGAQHVQVGLYEDDGDIPSRPSTRLVASSTTTYTPGTFTTITIPAVALTANTTYWLAFNTDDATMTRNFNAGNKNSCFYGLGFGFMPDPFGPGPCFFANEEYSMYLNYTSSAGPPGSFSKALLSLGPTGQVVFQNSVDSTTALQVQNAAGTSAVFNVDTLNGRIAIGKASANYKLDIAGGDINLSNNRSIRFAGSQALSVNNSGLSTVVSNFSANGTVVAQAANFVVQDANGAHQNMVVDSDGAASFSNRIDSAAGFKVQNAASVSLLTVDTAGLSVKIGNTAGSATPVVLYLANKNTAGDPAGAEGGIYYNSTLASNIQFIVGRSLPNGYPSV